MRFKLIKKETVVTKSACIVIRIMAVMDIKGYNECKLLSMDTVKLQRQVDKNKFETFATAEDLFHAGITLEDYINTFTFGQKYARI